MRNKTLVIALLGSGLILGLSFAQQPSGQTQNNNTAKEGAQQTCFKTVDGDKCGTDIEYSWTMCDGEKCVTHEVVYDTLKNTETADSGLTDIKIEMCQKHTITRVCTGEEFLECKVVNDVPEDALPGTVACGDICKPGPKKKGIPD